MVQATGNTIGPSTAPNPVGASQNEQAWYVSDYIPPPGLNVLTDVAANRVTLFNGDVGLKSTGTAATEIVANGVVIAQPGETTWAAITTKITAPSSDPLLNLMILASDEAKSGVDRCLNGNTKNEDGSVDRYFMMILAANPVKKAGNTLAGWEITWQPYGVDRRILATI